MEIISAVPTLLLVPIALVSGTRAATEDDPDVAVGGGNLNLDLDGLENLDDPKLNISPEQYQKWLKAYTKEYFRYVLKQDSVENASDLAHLCMTCYSRNIASECLCLVTCQQNSSRVHRGH